MVDSLPPGLVDFVATSAACVGANLLTHPLEFLKVRQQLYVSASGAEPSVFRLLPEILRTEGVRPLYNGLSAGLWRAVISGGGRLSIYNQLKLAAGEDLVVSGGVAGRAVLGMAAGGLAALLAVPFDMVRTRQQAHKTGKGPTPGALSEAPHARPPPSMGRIMVEVVRTEGVRGLWAGSVPTFVRQVVFTAVQLACYDRSKEAIMAGSTAGQLPAWCPHLGPRDVLTHFLASLVSGAASTLAIAPVEMVKTHMQMAGKGAGAASSSQGAGVVAVVRDVWATYGLRGFWRGAGPLYVRLAPHTALVFVGTEYFREVLGVQVGA